MVKNNREDNARNLQQLHLIEFMDSNIVPVSPLIQGLKPKRRLSETILFSRNIFAVFESCDPECWHGTRRLSTVRCQSGKLDTFWTFWCSAFQTRSTHCLLKLEALKSEARGPTGSLPSCLRYSRYVGVNGERLNPHSNKTDVKKCDLVATPCRSQVSSWIRRCRCND